MQQALASPGAAGEGVSAGELEELMAAAAADVQPAVASAVAMADLAVQRARSARSTEADTWA
jgi:hypothetical protein